MEPKKYKIVIESLGLAGAGLMRSLATALNWPANRVARLMYLSPQVLEGNLQRAEAEQLLGVLSETGLVASIQEQAVPIETGVADYDIALVVKNFTHIGSILRLITHILGVKPEKAREIICASPALLMGGVSRATVESLRPQFHALQVELDVAVRSESQYDLLLAPCPQITRQRVTAIVERHLSDQQKSDVAANAGGMIAMGLSFQQATTLWDDLRGGGAAVQMVNRSFERFDIVLKEAADSPALRAFLGEQCGIPERVMDKLLQRLPIVLQRQLNPEQTQHALIQLEELGAKAVAELTTFQAFDLSIDTVSGQMDKAVQVLASLADRSQIAAVSALHSTPAKLDGPFSSIHARWLQAELNAAGASSRLILRK